jgi:hypothetical protein
MAGLFEASALHSYAHSRCAATRHPYCFAIAGVSYSPLRAQGPKLIREVVESMSFTRRQILGGLAGLVVVGVGAGGASRYWLGKWPTPRRAMTTS